MYKQASPPRNWLDKNSAMVRRTVAQTKSWANRRGLVSLLMLVAALAATVVAYAVGARVPVVRSIEVGVRDGFVKLLADDQADFRIALVDIDEESLDRVGSWPWPRERLADLVEKLLSTQRAALVALDLVLPESSTGNDARGDARLAALGHQGLLIPAQAFDYVARAPRVAAGSVGGALVVPGVSMAVPATGYVANFPTLNQARCIGNVGFTPDFDGQVRRLPLITQWQGAHYPTLALATLLCARSEIEPVALISRLRIDANGQWPIPFNRKPDSFLTVPAAAVIRDTPGLPSLAGRIVLVGSSALGLSDRVATPLASSMAGVTVHAVALNALLDVVDGHFPVAPPGWLTFSWTAISTLLLWQAISGWRRLRWIAATLLVALVGWSAIAGWHVHSGSPAPVSAPLSSYAWLMLVYLPTEWSTAQARIRARTRLLSRYLARPVLDELLRNGGQNPLLPRHAEISVLIADMEDYTRITARSSLQEAAELTRQFLDCLTRPVLEQRGTLDKYTGDGLVAFWGAPLATDDHVQRALDAALAIHEGVARFNETRYARGAFPVRVRIGLACGRALVGDLGTPFRSTYTAVGDVINLASRLQEAARDCACDILVSRAMTEALPTRAFRPIGAITVRGLSNVEVFTPA